MYVFVFEAAFRYILKVYLSFKNIKLKHFLNNFNILISFQFKRILKKYSSTHLIKTIHINLPKINLVLYYIIFFKIFLTLKYIKIISWIGFNNLESNDNIFLGTDSIGSPSTTHCQGPNLSHFSKASANKTHSLLTY